jgi:hypothetical protein
VGLDGRNRSGGRESRAVQKSKGAVLVRVLPSQRRRVAMKILMSESPIGWNRRRAAATTTRRLGGARRYAYSASCV